MRWRRAAARRRPGSAVVEDDDPDAEHDLQHQQLDGERGRPCRGRCRPGRARQPQGVAGAVGRLERERPLDGEEQAEQDGQPEQAGRRPLEDAAVGVEGEGEQQQDEQGERQHLVGRRPGCGPRCAGPCRRPAAGSSARHDAHGLDRRRRRRRAVRPPGRARRERRSRATAAGGPDSKTSPPSTATARWARPAARSSSWDATTTVAPAAAAVRSSSSSRSRPSASRPAWGSSSSHSSGRRATSAASAVRRRWPADRRADRGAGEAAGQPEPVQRGVDLRVAGAHGAAPEADVLGDGQVVVEAVGVAEQARRGTGRRGGRRSGRRRARRPRPG